MQKLSEIFAEIFKKEEISHLYCKYLDKENDPLYINNELNRMNISIKSLLVYIEEIIPQLQQQIQDLKISLDNTEIYNRLADIDNEIQDIKQIVNPPKYFCPNCLRSDLDEKPFSVTIPYKHEPFYVPIDNCGNEIKEVNVLRCKYCVNEDKK
jgi:hypothetical protein